MIVDKLRCDICGGSLMMQAGGKTAVCDSCGMQYSVERMREKMQEIRGVVSVEGTVQTQDADFIIRGGVLTRYNGNDVCVTIPDTVVEIGKSAFEKCVGIRSVKMPQSVTCIGESAFSGCRLLEDIDFPNGLVEIHDRAFRGCVALKKIILPDTLVTIGNWTFSGCTSLESINIPDSVQKKQWYDLRGAFEDCPTLKEVHIADQQLKTLFLHKSNEKWYIDRDVFETTEDDSDGCSCYVATNCGSWYLNLKSIIESANNKVEWKSRGRCQYCGGEFVGGIFTHRRCGKCGKPKDY